MFHETFVKGISQVSAPITQEQLLSLGIYILVSVTLKECNSKFGNFINMYLKHRPFHLLCKTA